MDEEYKIACTEVLEIMNYISKEDYNKVPKDVIQTLERNKKEGLAFLYNPWEDINEQGISKQGRIMLASFFRDYWATDEQKNKIKSFQNNKIEKEKQEKYNPNELFNKPAMNNQKEKDLQENSAETSLIAVKENFFVKFINLIKNIFKRY